MNIDITHPSQIRPEDIMQLLSHLTRHVAPPQRNRAVIYVRKSRVLKHSHHHSPEIQERECHETASRLGLDVIKTISDLDKSGKNSNRPGLQKILEMVKSGEVDYIIIQYVDRSYRNGLSMLKFFEILQRYGAQLISVHEKIDTRDFGGRMMLFMLAVVAELPIFTASERGRLAAQERAKKGLHRGGYRLGYCNGLCSSCTDPNGKDYCPLFGGPDRPESQRGRIQVPHPIEMHVIRLIAYLFRDGLSSREISDYLNENEFIIPEATHAS
jgi:DNA invertase Pin-like site-specific DNA recombinase